MIDAIQHFAYVPGTTPLTQLWMPFVRGAIYWLGLYVCSRPSVCNRVKDTLWMKNLYIAHNGLLSVASGIMTLGLWWGMLHRISERGLFAILCDLPSRQGQQMTGPLGYWLYIY